jgi:hypothetical protein
MGDYRPEWVGDHSNCNEVPQDILDLI